MTSTLLNSLDSLATWRRTLTRNIERWVAELNDTGLLDAQAQSVAAAVRQRLASDRLVLAFVAEFSRGKSELINALFFADTGRRVLPATPGRTTMCPVELAWDAQQAPSLALLPIGTRSSGQTVAALREQPELWCQVPLPVGDADGMVQALQQVMRTMQVTLPEARALGFWSDEHPEDNPPRDAEDRVEVPAWRHALINYPHPLLKRGLVVVDTPGLNAIGAEPELTLALLPSAHAAVFVLAADTGVTRTDLSVWRDHLGDRGCERFVVLNKIDTLEDPLLDAVQIEAQVQQQCTQVAQTLGIEPTRVFPLSARKALAARVHGDEAALAASRLPALEHALLAQLLPQRSQVIGRMVEDGVLALQQTALRRLGDRRRQVAEQQSELRSLRGKSASRLQLMGHRLDVEVTEFERCAPRLSALRAVLVRQLGPLLEGLSNDRLIDAVRRMRDTSESGLLNLGAARAFARLGKQLKGQLAQAEGRCDEIEQMLMASARALNAEFGFSLAVAPRPPMDGHQRDLGRIEVSYSRYVSVTQAWRLSQDAFMDRFTHMLLSRLLGVFEAASNEIESWAMSIGTQIDDQLRVRRRSLAQRREAHSRIRGAEDGLEQSIHALHEQELQLQRQTQRLSADVDALRILAATPPLAEGGARQPHLQLVATQQQPARGAA